MDLRCQFIQHLKTLSILIIRPTSSPVWHRVWHFSCTKLTACTVANTKRAVQLDKTCKPVTKTILCVRNACKNMFWYVSWTLNSIPKLATCSSQLASIQSCVPFRKPKPFSSLSSCAILVLEFEEIEEGPMTQMCLTHELIHHRDSDGDIR